MGVIVVENYPVILMHVWLCVPGNEFFFLVFYVVRSCGLAAKTCASLHPNLQRFGLPELLAGSKNICRDQ
jgi:hypothetical protein